jgi:hypothetical protein
MMPYATCAEWQMKTLITLCPNARLLGAPGSKLGGNLITSRWGTMRPDGVHHEAIIFFFAAGRYGSTSMMSFLEGFHRASID